MEEQEIRFISSDGQKVVLIWQKNEYRAFREDNSKRLIDMRLGSASAENLKNYIMKGEY